MKFSTLINNPADWMMGEGEENDVVITSRVRLARNIESDPFPGWQTATQRELTLGKLKPALETIPEMKEGLWQDLADLSKVQKQVLVERHLISREHAAKSKGCAVLINETQSLSFMVNEEDHMRLQAMQPGLHLKEAYEQLLSAEQFLDQELEWAYDDQLGFLTACPSNLGTGMRASVMMHLPGLALCNQTKQVMQGLTDIGVAIRGFYGEGTEFLANLFQISNQATLGLSEEQIINSLTQTVAEVATQERYARQRLIKERPDFLTDQISRSYGLLKHAYLMESKETLHHLSLIRLGRDLGFFPKSSAQLCNTMLLDMQPGHLQLHKKHQMDIEQRDITRASIMRKMISSVPAPERPF